MTRVIVTEDQNNADEQVDALRRFLRFGFQVHQIGYVIIIVRDSPPNDQEDEYRISPTSLLRQMQFIDTVLPDGVQRKRVTLPYTSAFDGSELIGEIRRELNSFTGKAMLVTTALDRLVRSRATFAELESLVRRGDHMAMSFLWDTRTLIHPADSMLLEEGT